MARIIKRSNSIGLGIMVALTFAVILLIAVAVRNNVTRPSDSSRSTSISLSSTKHTSPVTVITRNQPLATLVTQQAAPHMWVPSSMPPALYNDVYTNPYHPPERENAYTPFSHLGNAGEYGYGGAYVHFFDSNPQTLMYVGMPVNVSTTGRYYNYNQVGLLKGGTGTMLPLFGMPSNRNRNRWNYFTHADKRSFIKLKVSHGGRDCSDDNGCDEIYDGDTVRVDGYDATFIATVYNMKDLKYIPSL